MDIKTKIQDLPIPVIFGLQKDLNGDINVIKIKRVNGEWFLFHDEHQDLSKHLILESKVKEAQFNEKGESEIDYYLLPRNRQIYLNSKYQFVFKRKLLIKESDLDQTNFEDYYFEKPNVQTSSPNQSNRPNQSATKNSTEDIVIEKFNENDDPFKFMDKFQLKFKNETDRGKFTKLGEYLNEEDNKFRLKSLSSLTWSLFEQAFLKKHGEEYRKRQHKLDRMTFDPIQMGNNLIEFVEKKFELYDNYMIGVPEDVQIKQIINSLPHELSKELFFNIDTSRQQFIERVQAIQSSLDEDKKNSDHDKQENGQMNGAKSTDAEYNKDEESTNKSTQALLKKKLDGLLNGSTSNKRKKVDQRVSGSTSSTEEEPNSISYYVKNPYSSSTNVNKNVQLPPIALPYVSLTQSSNSTEIVETNDEIIILSSDEDETNLNQVIKSSPKPLKKLPYKPHFRKQLARKSCGSFQNFSNIKAHYSSTESSDEE